MQKPTQKEIDIILGLTVKPLAAKNGKVFLAGIREGFESLRPLLTDSTSEKQVIAALEAAFSQTVGAFRRRRVLEMCVWPIYDKPALPLETKASTPEFLWLFCLPFVVQFSQASAGASMFLSDALFDGAAVLQDASREAWFNPEARLSGFPTLLTREDMHLLGPQNLATLFVAAETGHDAPLRPLPLILDSEIESARVTTFFMLVAARLPVGETSLQHQAECWPAERLERHILAGFAEHGIEAERVISLAPCSMSEAVLRSTRVGACEMTRVLALAKEHFGITEVVVLFPLEGMAELVGCDETGQSFILCSPFAFIEPCAELQACIEQVCQGLEIEFKGGCATAIPAGAMFH
jgi:hypothetical protein